MVKKEGYARLETHEDADADAVGGFVGGGASPELRAGFLSWSAIIFSWMTPLVRQGSVEPLQLEHLSQLNPQDTSAAVSARFQAEWAKELERRPAEPSLKRAMYLTFGRPWVKAGLFKLVHDIMAFGGPVFLDLLLQYLVRAQTEETSLLEGIAALRSDQAANALLRTASFGVGSAPEEVTGRNALELQRRGSSGRRRSRASVRSVSALPPACCTT